MSDEHSWILGVWNHTSRRHALLCNEGDSAWFYLTKPGPNGPGSPGIVASAFVYNLVSPPPKLTDVRSWAPGAPPAAEGFAGPGAYVSNLPADGWEIHWSEDGESVALLREGEPMTMIVGPGHETYSRHLLKEGGWGRPWSATVYHRTFGDADPRGRG